MKKGNWNETENDILKEMYGDPMVELEDIVKRINRSPQAIRARALKLGLKRPPISLRVILKERLTEERPILLEPQIEISSI